MQSQSLESPANPSPARPKKRPTAPVSARFWLRPAPPEGFKFPTFLRKLGFQLPDCQRNPALWPVRWVYGDGILKQTLEAASRATSILVVGDSTPWLSWELARANPKARVLAVLPAPPKPASGALARRKRLDWGREQFLERWPEQLDIVEFSSDSARLLEAEAGSFDLVIWNFVSSSNAEERPRWLEACLKSLKTEGELIYYEATAPSPFNLERWTRWSHFWSRLRGGMTDPWNQRRAIENLYLEDALRVDGRVEQEADLFRTLQVHLQLNDLRRTRPLADTLLTGVDRRFWLNLGPILMWDTLCLKAGWLDGCCRFARLTKKS